MRRVGLWLRWSVRDLRRRWMMVAALALVIAIGTGAAAALSGVSQWRRMSNDASYAQLGMHDIKISFGASRTDAIRALSAVRRIPHASWLRQTQAGLDVPTQVEVVTDGRTRVLPGRLVGVDVSDGGPRVDKLLPAGGAPLTTANTDGDAADPVGVLERGFARQYKLPTSGTVRVAGGTEVRYVGWAQSPTYLLNSMGGVQGDETQAVVFTPLPVAQRLAGTPGQVNEVLLALAPGADRGLVHREIVDALRNALPDVPATVAERTDDPTYRMLYRDADNDQQMFTFMAFLVLGGAALATFNLANRVVTAQRREIGIGMALGLRAPALAIRPLLFGLEIALLGVLAGIGVGLLLGAAMKDIFAEMLPLPTWRTPFLVGPYARAAVLGVVVPLLGIVYPVWRAVRVQPADAIRTAHIAGRIGRIGRLLQRIPLPGRSFAHLPVRHVMRAPGRTALTAAGVGAAIAAMVAVFGMLDSLTTAMDRGEDEITRGVPDRTVVSLNTFYPSGSPQVTAVARLPEVAQAQPALRVPAKATGRTGGKTLDLVVDILDFHTAMWKPTLVDADPASAKGVPDGIVLAEKAAEDLGVRPGDSIVIEHPRRHKEAGLQTVTTRMRVAAVHPHPLRMFAYLDAGRADLFGLKGFANQVQIRPKSGVSEAQLRQALLGNSAVGGVQPVVATSRAVRDLVKQFMDVISLLTGFVLVLTLLIAFNAASINADERTREHATIYAFGLGSGRVLGNSMLESLLIGLLGTAFGLLVGGLAVAWLVGKMAATTMPDLGITPTLGAPTVLLSLAVGVVAVTVAPLLTLRRLRRLDIPAALRVVE